LELRYAGQGYSLAIPARLENRRIETDASRLVEDFSAAYERTFRYRLTDPIEIVAIRVNMRTTLPRRSPGRSKPPADWERNLAPVDAYSFTQRGRMAFD